MAKRQKTNGVSTVRNELLAPKVGEYPVYELILSDEEVEQLASGRVSPAVQDSAWQMLGWKRTANQDWASYDCKCGQPCCTKAK